MDKDKRKPLGLSAGGQIKKESLVEKIHQNLSHGRSKDVSIEVKKKKGKLIVSEKRASDKQDILSLEKKIRLDALQRAVKEREEAKKKEHSDEVAARKDAPSGVFAPEKSGFEEFAKKKKREKHEGGKSDYKLEDVHEREHGVVSKKEHSKSKKFSSRAGSAGDDDGAAVDFVSKGIAGIAGLKKLRSRKKPPPSVKKEVCLRGSIKLGDLSTMMGEKVSALTRLLRSLDVSGLDRSSVISKDHAVFLAESLGHTVVYDDALNPRSVLENQKPANTQPRPPVVVVMGHVDHGKTSLLDALRHTNVTDAEVGGITQSIGAYRVHLDSGRSITFIDTPGHQAFSKMRARGANTTDIVVLVVAADEGVNEQTVESIQHCRSSGVPMIVAITKMDKPGADPDRVIQQLLSHEVVVEKMGGDVQSVAVSSVQKTGLQDLEEAILLQGDLMGLSADPTMRPSGIILETKFIKGHGFAVTALVQEGTLKRGDVFVVGRTWGRVRFLMDESGHFVDKAVPSQPVVVIGFPSTTAPGESFFVAPSEAEAKALSLIGDVDKEDEGPSVDMSFLQDCLGKKDKKSQKIVIKADCQGSVEALLNEIGKISQDEIAVDVIHSGIGAISESDIMLATQANAIVVQFNVPMLSSAQKMSLSESIRVVKSSIIYHIMDDVRSILSDLLDPVYEDSILGEAKIIQVFHMTGKVAACIAGCLVKSGVMRRGEWARIVRNKETLFEGKIKSLRHLKDDVKEKGAGYECGILLEGYSDFKIDDKVYCFSRKKIKRSI